VNIHRFLKKEGTVRSCILIHAQWDVGVVNFFYAVHFVLKCSRCLEGKKGKQSYS